MFHLFSLWFYPTTFKKLLTIYSQYLCPDQRLEHLIQVSNICKGEVEAFIPQIAECEECLQEAVLHTVVTPNVKAAEGED